VTTSYITLNELRGMPPTVAVEIAAKVLGVSRSTAYEAIRTGTFPVRVITVSRRKLVVTASLVELLESGPR
jgi:predicted site-specific integrase-resolvase